jgi:hypothetical protein
MSSLSQTLEPLVSIPLDTRKLVYIYFIFVLSCAYVEALKRADPRPSSPANCVHNHETENAARFLKGP